MRVLVLHVFLDDAKAGCVVRSLLHPS